MHICEIRKMVPMNLFQGRYRDARVGKGHVGTGLGLGGVVIGWTGRPRLMYMHYLVQDS